MVGSAHPTEDVRPLTVYFASSDPLDEPRVHVAALEVLVVHDLQVQRDRGLDRGDVELAAGRRFIAAIASARVGRWTISLPIMLS